MVSFVHAFFFASLWLAQEPGEARTESAYTSTAASAIDSEEPLSPEDLALIESLDDSKTATASVEPSANQTPVFWLAPEPLARPTLDLPRLRIRESVGRSIAEAYDDQPTPVDSARRYIPGDSA